MTREELERLQQSPAGRDIIPVRLAIENCLQNLRIIELLENIERQQATMGLAAAIAGPNDVKAATLNQPTPEPPAAPASHATQPVYHPKGRDKSKKS
jgi:hypothetical protein